MNNDKSNFFLRDNLAEQIQNRANFWEGQNIIHKEKVALVITYLQLFFFD